MGFPEKLKHSRMLKGYTQSEVAKLVGISTSTYVSYEKGLREPKLKTLIEIIKVLDIDANYLLKDEYCILAYVTE